MVNIIDDWEVLEGYAGEKLGFYQRLDSDGKVEIRVQTGRVGYIGKFESEKDPLLIRIEDFCRRQMFIKVSEYMRDEDFFK